MATIASRRKQSIFQKLKGLVTSSQGMPIILTLAIISILFVLFRMKGVEIDYKLNTVNQKTKEEVLNNKELKAKKANLLSVGRLRKLAKKHNLQEPKQKQIIVVP